MYDNIVYMQQNSKTRTTTLTNPNKNIGKFRVIPLLSVCHPDVLRHVICVYCHAIPGKDTAFSVIVQTK